MEFQLRDQEKMTLAVGQMIIRLTQIKTTIEGMLLKLELQYNVPYEAFVNEFASIAAELSSIQMALRKSALPNYPEDNGQLLKSNVIVPRMISMEPDPLVQKVTDGRIASVNHEILPYLLRTKLTPEMEEEERKIENDRSSRANDTVLRQQPSTSTGVSVRELLAINLTITTYNKHLDALSSKVSDLNRRITERHQAPPTYRNSDTITLVRAIMRGEGLKPNVSGGLPAAPPPSGGAGPSAMGGAGPAHPPPKAK